MEATYINNPLQHFSTEQCIRKIQGTSYMLTSQIMDTTYIFTYHIIHYTIGNSQTGDCHHHHHHQVFKNITLCNLVANVAMIHRNLLPSYGEERSACSSNTLVPPYSKTQHHIQQDRILNDINYFLSLKESYNSKINKSQSNKASWCHTSKKQTV